MNRINKLIIPALGLLNIYAIQPTKAGPTTTADLPIKLLIELLMNGIDICRSFADAGEAKV